MGKAALLSAVDTGPNNIGDQAEALTAAAVGARVFRDPLKNVELGTAERHALGAISPLCERLRKTNPGTPTRKRLVSELAETLRKASGLEDRGEFAARVFEDADGPEVRARAGLGHAP